MPDWYSGRLPTFEDIRREAYRLLGDAQDVLRSDWAPGTGPTTAQAFAVHDARLAIADAKRALNDAAHPGRNRDRDR